MADNFEEFLSRLIDPSPEIEESSSDTESEDARNAVKEEEQLERDKREYYKNLKKEAKIAASRQEMAIKQRFSDQIILYLWFFSAACLVIIFLQGFSPKLDLHLNIGSSFHFKQHLDGFHINNTSLTTLIGSTAASALGLVAIILRGLFKPKPEKKAEKEAAKQRP
ncbi:MULTISPECIES: hypothetical protein [Asaia]|uniref:hypothetical protein n=1 Tax=Asaia TaxID=91914 RepID=UPI0003D3B2C3|nr:MULTISPECIES: hypothetical protein [Asaia]ETD00053.1 hypothetical protein P792_00280 [Asaia sp. SF2.1]